MDKVAYLIIQGSDGAMKTGQFLFQQFLEGIGYQQLAVTGDRLAATDARPQWPDKTLVSVGGYGTKEVKVSNYIVTLAIQLR